MKNLVIKIVILTLIIASCQNPTTEEILTGNSYKYWQTEFPEGFILVFYFGNDNYWVPFSIDKNRRVFSSQENDCQIVNHKWKLKNDSVLLFFYGSDEEHTFKRISSDTIELGGICGEQVRFTRLSRRLIPRELQRKLDATINFKNYHYYYEYKDGHLYEWYIGVIIIGGRNCGLNDSEYYSGVLFSRTSNGSTRTIVSFGHQGIVKRRVRLY